MAVENADVVDALGVDKETGAVILSILDALPWEYDDHLQMLEAKINRYLAFIESGELLRSYPDAKGRRVRISVVCKYQPTTAAEEALFGAATTLSAASIPLTWHVH